MVLNKQFYRKKAHQGASLLIINGLFFGLTDPARAPSFMFIIAFLLASLSIYWLANVLFRLAAWYGAPIKHKKRAVLTSTGFLMCLMALQSTGTLGAKDIIIALPFVAVGYFYISYQQRAYQT